MSSARKRPNQSPIDGAPSSKKSAKEAHATEQGGALRDRKSTLLFSENLSDVVFEVGQARTPNSNGLCTGFLVFQELVHIPAHSAILSAASTGFELALASSSMASKVHIAEPNASAEGVRAMLK